MTASPRPQISLSTEMQPSDYLAIGSIHVRTFTTSNPAKDRLCFPPHLGATIHQRTEFNAHRRRKAALSEPDLICVKASLPDGTIVGAASWYTPVDRTSTGGDPLPKEIARDEEASKGGKTAEEEEWAKMVDGEWAGKLGDELDRVRKEWTRGRRHWYLSLVVVDPDYAGLGIGSALLKWGMDRAEADGLPLFLEASESGRPLYEHRGFRIVNWCELPDPASPDGKLRIPGMACGDFP